MNNQKFIVMKESLLLLTLFTVSIVNAQTQLLSSVDQFNLNQSWENHRGYNYEYDANNNLISTTSYTWNGDVWSKFHKETYTYNANDKVLTYNDQVYDTNTNMFIDDDRTTNTYDVNNNVTEYLDEIWDGSQWQNDYKSVFSYSDGNIDIVIGQSWNGSAWDNENQSTLTYNNNRLEQFDSEEWVNGAWVTSYRAIFTYNANNYIINNVYEIWDGSAYLEESRADYTIDSDGNRLSEEVFFQLESSRTNYTYDNTQLMSAFDNPFADKTGFDYLREDFPYHNKILSEERNAFGDGYRTIYNYDTALTLSVDSAEYVSTFSIYPNPVKNVLNIETLSVIDIVEVYNMLGRKVLTSNSTKLNVTHLSEGVYTLKIINNLGNKTVRKIIKQ